MESEVEQVKEQVIHKGTGKWSGCDRSVAADTNYRSIPIWSDSNGLFERKDDRKVIWSWASWPSKDMEAPERNETPKTLQIKLDRLGRKLYPREHHDLCALNSTDTFIFYH